MLISILSNSSNLLRVDLDGVTVLVPVIVTALEAVLPTKDALRSDLRRSAIQLLLSLLALPLHFLVNYVVLKVIILDFFGFHFASIFTKCRYLIITECTN